eukprot:5443638-Alexandrium_andersonii.AAC.1
MATAARAAAGSIAAGIVVRGACPLRPIMSSAKCPCRRPASHVATKGQDSMASAVAVRGSRRFLQLPAVLCAASPGGAAAAPWTSPTSAVGARR